MKKYIFILFIAALSGSVIAQNPTGEEILNRVDKNMVIEQAVSVASMTIHARSGSRTIKSKSWTKGRNNVFVEYLSPAREKGKKMLKIGDKLWNYTPEPNDRIITISGHLLRQSVMGSDLSYEDMMENHKMTELYYAEVNGSEELDGRNCWVLTLTAKTEDVAYHSRKIWIDSERWLPMKEERFAKSGKLLKTTVINEVFQIGERWYPKKMVFKDMLSRGEGTEYIIESIDFDVDIPDHLMTKAALRE
ncbi:outer membrane lipoprotein-sorting protein [Candidatus Latescibacterota bacterium]